MNITSALYSGMQGLQRAGTGITEATQNIQYQTTVGQAITRGAADNEVQTEQPIRNVPAVGESLIELKQHELLAQANVRSIRTADDMLGSIIDIRV